METNSEHQEAKSERGSEGAVDQPRLVRLPNGAWVRPNAVTVIRPLKTEKGSCGDLHRARVVVDHGGFHEILLANDNEHAQAMADELAGLFNGESNDHRELPPPTMPENTTKSYGG